MRSVSVDGPPPSQRKLLHFTPLRYPGGKAKLATFVKSIIEENHLVDGEYVEPYAGGAAIGLELLFHEYVSKIYINDISRPVYAFWKSVLQHTEELVRMVCDTKLSVNAWDKQKKILSFPADHDDLELGFATFYLNRTNRSGILNGGIIGGRDQSGPWKIDARYNAKELAYRITEIAKLKERIKLTKKDAADFIRKGASVWQEKTLVYLDPPYYLQGKGLYYDFYTHDDHEKVASIVMREIKKQKWIVSYDNTKEIRKMYSGCKKLTYALQYSARESKEGSEVMFFADGLKIPAISSPMRKCG